MRIVENMRTKDWRPLFLLPAVLFLQSNGFGQSSDDYIEDLSEEGNRPKSGFVNPFSKIFAKKSTAEHTNDDADDLSHSNARSNTGTGGTGSFGSRAAANESGTRGGLFVPLKSFTNRVFQRPPTDVQPSDYPSYENDSAMRGIREPFQSTGRARIVQSREGSQNSHEDVADFPAAELSRPRISTSFPGERKSGSEQDSLAPVVTRPNASVEGMGKLKEETKESVQSAANDALGEYTTSRRAAEKSRNAPLVKPQSESPAASSVPSLIDLSMDAPAKNVSNSRSASANANEIDDEVSIPRGGAILDVSSSKKMTQREYETELLNSANTVPLPRPSAGNRESGESDNESSSRTYISARNGASPSSGSGQTAASSPNDTLGTMQLPGVRVTVQGPSSLLVGQESMFEIVARNDGPVDLDGLLLRLSVPENVTIGNIYATDGGAESELNDGEKAIVWELPSLPARSHKSMRITLQTSKPEHFAMGVEWTAVPQMQEYSIKVQQPQLELALEGPSEAEFGTPLNYRLRVKNPGNAVAKNVVLELNAASFGNNKSPIGDIQPGSERTVDVELLFEQSGIIPINAIAKSEASNIEAKSDIDVRVRQSALQATWTGPTEFYQGSVAEYQLVLTNQGDAAATNATCVLILPDGATPVTLPAGSLRKGNKIEWEVKQLAAHATVTIPLSFSFATVGENAISFQANCKSGVELLSNYKTNVDSIVDLQLSVHDPAAPAPVGQEVYYDLEIYNRGKKVATSVDVLVQFSEGVEPMRCEGNEARIVPGQVIFNTIPTIAAGEKIKLRVIAESSQAGVHRFRVEVKSGNGEADLLQEASTRYLETGAKRSRN